MRKYLIISALLILLGCSNSTKKDFYTNGNLKSVYNFSDGILDGAYEIYYESGKLQEKGGFFNGWKVDTIFKYYKSGELSELNVFISKSNMKVIKYDSLGNIFSEGNIKNNDSVGWWNYFYPNGNLRFKKEFWKTKNENIVNQYVRFNEKSEIDKKKSLFININKSKDILEYHSPYKNLIIGKDRFLWLMVIDTLAKSTYKDAIIDTLYPYNSTDFSVVSNKYYKGFIKEQVFVDTVVNENKMILIREINTFFNKEKSTID